MTATTLTVVSAGLLDALDTLRAIAADLERGAAFAGPQILPDVITARQRALAALARLDGGE